uniref:Uncharacterized protein n=1 Tax=Moumouvirus sp. 'Monve' TaxID=1128131 RepID=H2ED82_9VIRU|nr:hypothetical protein mv_L150 [Moumouvirus Monve]
MYILITNSFKEFFESLMDEDNLSINGDGFYYTKSSTDSIIITKLKYINQFYDKGTDITIINLPKKVKNLEWKK